MVKKLINPTGEQIFRYIIKCSICTAHVKKFQNLKFLKFIFKRNYQFWLMSKDWGGYNDMYIQSM